jgi:hypothetical protein
LEYRWGLARAIILCRHSCVFKRSSPPKDTCSNLGREIHRCDPRTGRKTRGLSPVSYRFSIDWVTRGVPPGGLWGMLAKERADARESCSDYWVD